MTNGRRVALVTGAAVGIGRVFAQRLAADGFAVAAVDRQSVDDTAGAAEGAATIVGFHADVTDPASVEACVAEVTATLGAPAVLVNNVGVYPVVRWDDLTLDELHRQMAINLDSVFLMAKACIPAMRGAGWGRIVNMASRTFWLTAPDMAAYLAGKGAVIGLTRALATELGPHGITVNAISPGLTRTASIEAVTAAPVFDMTRNMQPIKRIGLPEDLAGVLSFLASEGADFMTGQTLMVDGGLTRL